LLIILAQWFAGGSPAGSKQKILLIVPPHLKSQWQKIFDAKVRVPSLFLDSKAEFDTFEFDGVVVTTYDFAIEKAFEVERIKWDTVVFDEAGRLCKCHDETAKEARILKQAVGDAFKILLTATPLQLNIMDLFGLMYFVDDTIFPNADDFYKRYFRKPENYPELAARSSKYCYRVLREQTKSFVKIPERCLITAEFDYSP
jgi:SNF2 family DNA or RNA helicase